MNQINQFLSNFAVNLELMDIVIALAIVVIFFVLSPIISYVIIKLFNMGKKNYKVKLNPFYKPIKGVLVLLGLYVAVIFLQQPLNISAGVMKIIDTIFKVLATILFARALAKSITTQSSFVRKIRKNSKKDVDDTMLAFALKVVRGAIYVIAILLIIMELGIDITALVAGLGIGTVVLTLAAQDTAKNLIGGVVIFLDKPFILGDWIQVDLYEGIVEDITFRSTRVRTFENSLVNIPNSVLANASITNWSRVEKRRYRTRLCLEIGTPLEKVQDIEAKIKMMLLKHEQILDDTIMVRLEQITNNGLSILINTYTDAVDYASYLEEVEAINFKIMTILKNEGIDLAYDTQTIHIKK